MLQSSPIVRATHRKRLQDTESPIREKTILLPKWLDNLELFRPLCEIIRKNSHFDVEVHLIQQNHARFLCVFL